MGSVSLERLDSPTVFISGHAWAHRNDEARYRDYGTHDEQAAEDVETIADALDVSSRELPSLPLPKDLPELPAKGSLEECQAIITSLPPVAIYWNPGPWPVCNGRPMRLLLVNPTKSEWAWLNGALGAAAATMYINDELGDDLGDDLGAEPTVGLDELDDELVEQIENELGHNIFQCLETGRVAAVMTHT